jgi:putative transposase
MEFQRKSIRLPASRYIGRNWYFLTLVTEGRIPRFLNPDLVSGSLNLLGRCSGTERFRVWAYCFMPDHLHVLTSGTTVGANLLRFLALFKQQSGYLFSQQNHQRLWQKKYYDHILRASERWEPIACYIWMNPARKSLCSRPEDWRFSGSFTLDWRKMLTLGVEPWTPAWKTHRTGPPQRT